MRAKINIFSFSLAVVLTTIAPIFHTQSQDLVSPADSAAAVPINSTPTDSQVIEFPTEPTVGGAPSVGEVSFGPVSHASAETNGGLPPPRHWKLLLGISASAAYDNNIFLVHTGREADFIWTVTPTVGLQLGDSGAGRNFFSLNYSPSVVLFTDHTDQNAVEHDVDLRFVTQSDYSKLIGSFQFLDLSGGSNPDRTQTGAPLGENVGERVDRQVYTGGLRYSHQITDKTSWGADLSADYTQYASSEFINTLNLIDSNFLDYKYSDITSFGLGFSAGYAKSQGGPNQVYEQGNFRVQYVPTSKLTFAGNGGIETRQIQGNGTEFNGVFNLGVTFAPSEHTSFNLNAYREVRPSSILADTNYTVTGVAISASQQFRDRFTASVTAGYENSNYQSIGSTNGFSREDNYFFARPTIQYQAFNWGTIALFFEYRDNKSDPLFAFYDYQVGLKIGLSY